MITIVSFSLYYRGAKSLGHHQSHGALQAFKMVAMAISTKFFRNQCDCVKFCISVLIIQLWGREALKPLPLLRASAKSDNSCKMELWSKVMETQFLRNGTLEPCILRLEP